MTAQKTMGKDPEEASKRKTVLPVQRETVKAAVT